MCMTSSCHDLLAAALELAAAAGSPCFTLTYHIAWLYDEFILYVLACC